MKKYVFLFFMFLLVGMPQSNAQLFSLRKTSNGFLLLDNGNAVLQFQRYMNESVPEMARNNYFHPLYDLNGREITEDFPKDHPHHRGIFWSWHQLSVKGEAICNPWLLQNFAQEVDDFEFSTLENGTAMMAYQSWWQTTVQPVRKLVLEQSIVTVFPVIKGVRRIDFKIGIKALEPSVMLGGSTDEKGYGGFSIRMKTDSTTQFLGPKGQVTPTTNSMDIGDFVNIVNTEKGQGLTLVTWPINQGKHRWILRQSNSMQNIAWPGRDPVLLSTDNIRWLQYSLLIHDGSLKNKEIKKLIKKMR